MKNTYHGMRSDSGGWLSALHPEVVEDHLGLDLQANLGVVPDLVTGVEFPTIVVITDVGEAKAEGAESWS